MLIQSPHSTAFSLVVNIASKYISIGIDDKYIHLIIGFRLILH
uniref:Uncharacterized protein n=1 Tax=Rhizophora mucronata TaxID=61149 RepID=A0A2P2JF82_RHIMU